MSVDTEAPPQPQARRRRTWRRVVVGTLAAMLLAGIAWAAWWWSHPDVLQDFNAETGVDKPVPVDRAAMAVNVTMPTTSGSRRTFTVRNLSAHLDTNTAEATARFEMCDIRPKAGGMFYLWPRAGLDEFCSDLRPVTGPFRLTYPSKHQALLLVLTATRPGKVHLDRVDVGVQLGAGDFYRRGTDSVRFDDRFSAR
jgi:hypothetical protein